MLHKVHILKPQPLPYCAVAITVTTIALDRVSGVVCGDACVPGFALGVRGWSGAYLARKAKGWRVSR